MEFTRIPIEVGAEAAQNAQTPEKEKPAKHIRTLPIPFWVKQALDRWTEASGIKDGCLFRAIDKSGQIWGQGMTPKVLWEVVERAAEAAGIDKLAPNDLRRTCARLCHLSGGEFDQIQFLLGYISIKTTEVYLGCKQKLRFAVNDKTGIDPKPKRRLLVPSRPGRIYLP